MGINRVRSVSLAGADPIITRDLSQPDLQEIDLLLSTNGLLQVRFPIAGEYNTILPLPKPTMDWARSSGRRNLSSSPTKMINDSGIVLLILPDIIW